MSRNQPSDGREHVFDISYNRGLRVFMTALFAGPRHSSVVVGVDEIVVRMGVGGWAFLATVPRSSITAVDTDVSGPVWGWGAHGWRGRWLVNGSSQGLVRLRIAPSADGRCLGFPLRVRELTLSLTDPEGFARAVAPAP